MSTFAERFWRTKARDRALWIVFLWLVLAIGNVATALTGSSWAWILVALDLMLAAGWAGTWWLDGYPPEQLTDDRG